MGISFYFKSISFCSKNEKEYYTFVSFVCFILVKNETFSRFFLERIGLLYTFAASKRN